MTNVLFENAEISLMQWFLTFFLPFLPGAIVLCFKPPWLWISCKNKSISW